MVTADPGTLAIEGVDGRNLYYVTAVAETSALWRLPLAGGPAAKLLEGVAFGNFDVTDDGIYYIDRPGPGNRLRFFSFATAQSTTVAEDIGNVAFGLTASRDGGRVYFARIDSSADELMLVDDFR